MHKGERESEDCNGFEEDQQQQHRGGHHGGQCCPHHGQRGCQPEWQHHRGPGQPGAAKGHGEVSWTDISSLVNTMSDNNVRTYFV